MSFTCSICGVAHEALPHLGSAAPFHWADRLASDPNSLLTEDLCIIENRDFFIRGVIEIPVHDYKHEFGWGVWVSHKRENFEIYRENSGSADIGPFFGWLCTKIDYYSDNTLQMRTRAHYRGGGLRPRIELAECDHRLYHQQRDGISLSEAWEIVHHYAKEF